MTDNRKLSDFRPLERNPNRHTQRGLRSLEASVGEDGWVAPITVAADGEGLDGSARLEVAFDKFDDDVLVIEHDGTKPVVMVRTDIPHTETARARRIIYRANRVAEIDLDWDLEMLLEDAEALPDDLWYDDELGALLAQFVEEEEEEPEPPVDKAEVLQEKWNVKRGDVWACNGHFIICGDCREAETWETLLTAAKVDKVNGVFTSPPYAEQRKKQYGSVPTSKYVTWWEAVQENVRAHLADDGSFFVNIKPHCSEGERVLYVFDLVLAMKRQWGWRFVDELCWTRTTLPGEFPDRFKNGFEPIYQFSNGQCKFKPGNVLKPFEVGSEKMPTYDEAGGTTFGMRGGRKSKNFDMALPDNVIQAHRDHNSPHRAVFPVPLPAFFVKAYSDTGDVWIDPFAGSGTTIVAAHKNDRRGLGIEILERYVSVILERLANPDLEPKLVS